MSALCHRLDASGEVQTLFQDSPFLAPLQPARAIGRHFKELHLLGRVLLDNSLYHCTSNKEDYYPALFISIDGSKAGVGMFIFEVSLNLITIVDLDWSKPRDKSIAYRAAFVSTR